MIDQTAPHESVEPPDSVILPRRRVQQSMDLDITPMIDIVFLLLIFFIVASTPDTQRVADLPSAQFGAGIDPNTAVIFTIAKREGPRPAEVYLGDGKIGTPLPDDPQQQKEAISDAVETAYKSQGKSAVLIKGDKDVLRGDVARVDEAVGEAEVEGIQLYYAVFESR